MGYNDSTPSPQSAEEIKIHSFFSPAPSDPDEESHYLAEESERLRHQEALNRAAVSNSLSGSIVRRLSYSAGNVVISYHYLSVSKTLKGPNVNSFIFVAKLSELFVCCS